MAGNKNAGEKRTRSLRIMNMHIPYHIVMIIWSFISIFPLFFLVINTFKVKKEIYINFFGLPQKWTLENYTSLMSNSDFFGYFRNSFLVVVVSLSMILLVGSLCAYALAHWRTKTSKVVYYFFIIGMMLPIKIATIRLLQIMKALNTLNTLFCLFPVYIAMGLPTAIFILTEFIHGLPRELQRNCLLLLLTQLTLIISRLMTRRLMTFWRKQILMEFFGWNRNRQNMTFFRFNLRTLKS